MKSGVQKIGTMKGCAWAPKIGAPEIFLDQWIHQGKVGDECHPGNRGDQAYFLYTRRDILGDAEFIPEKIQGDPTASAQENADQNPLEVVAGEQDLDRNIGPGNEQGNQDREME